MELIEVVETEKVGNEVVLSEYELERRKPMPNLITWFVTSKFDYSDCIKIRFRVSNCERSCIGNRANRYYT